MSMGDRSQGDTPELPIPRFYTSAYSAEPTVYVPVPVHSPRASSRIACTVSSLDFAIRAWL